MATVLIETDIKEGDTVICTNAEGNQRVKLGEEYKVLHPAPVDGRFLRIELPNGDKTLAYRWRMSKKAKPKYSTPNGKHKWCDVIVAWAEGAEIQFKPYGCDSWRDYSLASAPTFGDSTEYRIKPEKSDALVAAEKQLAAAEKALQAAQQAVQQAQEG